MSTQTVTAVTAPAAVVASPASTAVATAAATVPATLEALPSPTRVLISNVLGYIVSLGSAVVKVPQILTLYRSQSTVGLSLSMYSVELFSQSIAVLYHRAHGFPFATYGENVSLGLGNLAILAYFAKLNRDPRAVVSLCFPLILQPLVRFPSFLAFLQSLSIPLNIFSKFPQIMINASVAAVLSKQIRKVQLELELSSQQQLPPTQSLARSPSISNQQAPPGGVVLPPVPSASSLPGLLLPTSSSRQLPASQLSPIPFALNFLGSFSRLFTTITQLKGDRLMLLGFFISCLLNGAIVAQCAQIRQLQAQLTEVLRQQQQSNKQN